MSNFSNCMIHPFWVQITSMRQEPHLSLNRTCLSLPSNERNRSKEVRQELQGASYSIFWVRRLSTKAGWFYRIKLTAPVGWERLKEVGRLVEKALRAGAALEINDRGGTRHDLSV